MILVDFKPKILLRLTDSVDKKKPFKATHFSMSLYLMLTDLSIVSFGFNGECVCLSKREIT